MVFSIDETFLSVFERGDLAAARDYIEGHPSIGRYNGYEAHPLLRSFVLGNCGHCCKSSHLAIADLLTPRSIRAFRDAVIAGRIGDMRSQLETDPRLVHAEFTAGRGIARAIHHWHSIPAGELLLDRGSDVNALTTVGCAGETPLMMQLRFGTLEGVRLLLNRGADPNIRDVEGRTALHLVSARGVGTDAIQDLVAAGSDLDARDQEGRTPLDYADTATRTTAARVLEELGAGRN